MDHIANRTDEALQRAAQEALSAAIGAEAAHVGVAAVRGEVTLTGEVALDAEREAAHAAVAAVSGIHALADDVVVGDTKPRSMTDTNIAIAAQEALQRATGVPIDAVLAEVRDRIVTLTGKVSSPHERLAAETAVTYLPGLERVNNRVTIRAES